MGELLMAIGLLCGGRVQSTTLSNASGEYVNGYAHQAAKVCQKALIDCVESKTNKDPNKDLYECLKDGN